MNTIEAVYEGGVFRPLVPPDLFDGQRVRISVEIPEENDSEDRSLWDAVRANQAYKARHPDEEPERYGSGAEFLKAVEDL
ncbi:antitoxin family protein [Desulfobacterales bacterium HSG2]|nr:antitoxin family protein [Desulfobacterales bacterium HSG2]